MISSFQPNTAFAGHAGYNNRYASAQPTPSETGLKENYQNLSPEEKNNLHNQIDSAADNKKAETAESRDTARQAGVAVVQYQSEKDLVTSQLDSIDGDSGEDSSSGLSLSATSVARGVYQHQRNETVSTTYQLYQNTQQLSERHQAAQAYNSQPIALQAYTSPQTHSGQALNILA